MPHYRTIAGRTGRILALVAGSYMLYSTWVVFNRFAVNRSSAGSTGWPAGWSLEIMAWYAIPGLELGILLGLLPAAVRSGFTSALRVLVFSVWCQVLANFCVFLLVHKGI
ncbi:MAG: hypothetical protein ACKVVP_05365 [Chloroflexota bacterium]